MTQFNREEIEVLLETFEDLIDEFSFNSHGTLSGEQWELYNKLRNLYDNTK